ncbi:MAG TPA: primosomal protein N' [Ktedonobacteraceae bacterium]|nr:primosomal protein N' [Ktedonobacteraceae bacterium]
MPVFAAVLTSAASWQGEQPLLTYAVPDELQEILSAGQLVAVPYGERLVEGVVWHIFEGAPGEHAEVEYPPFDLPQPVRPIQTILDIEPALLPHQRALAEWMATYYVAPLSLTAFMMLPPGLMQRSQSVLHLVKSELLEREANRSDISLRLRALIGLLLAEGELDVERLKEMLGQKKAKELLREAMASGLIEREAQLSDPRVKKRQKRVVRVVASGEKLATWRQRALERCQQEEVSTAINVAPDNVRRRPNAKQPVLDPWGLSGSGGTGGSGAAATTLTLTAQDKAALQARRQLVAVDLLEYSASLPAQGYWTPGALCKASALTPKQLQSLVQEGIISIEEVEVQRDPLAGRTIAQSDPLPLTRQQQQALDVIIASIATPLPRPPARGGPTIRDDAATNGERETGGDIVGPSLAGGLRPVQPILLHGVTGSGKTEIYLQALAAMIARGKRGIVLVPEIALTAQAVQRFAGRFPGRVAIIHSALSQGERYDEWRRIRAGEVDVVIGSRSAIFSPLPDLGIIILDEEHEPAYKHEFRPTYHAREVALRLGRILNIPVVLGSATPAIESYYRAEQGQYRLVELASRISATLPPVEVIDLRNELQAGNTSIISRRLQAELERVLQAGQQAILFLNRRGAASCVLCRECGFVVMCDRCDMPMTYHSTERILLCHYCNRQSHVLTCCPQCNSRGIRYFGLGTEKVEDTIKRAFPGARLLRWDRDTARHRHAHEQLLERFANREADILIGTQMIAKGLDIPGVTLVGVISADIALNLPDFAAAERAFTLLTQVAGRAGRGQEPGVVIIQTFNPQHFCIDAASRHAYTEFYATEIDVRRRYGYPPFRRFVKFTYSHENRQRAQNEALLLRERLDDWIERLGMTQTDIVGPAPALMERVRGKFHWQMIARGPDLHRLLRVVDAPGWQIDIDPVSTI